MVAGVRRVLPEAATPPWDGHEPRGLAHQTCPGSHQERMKYKHKDKDKQKDKQKDKHKDKHKTNTKTNTKTNRNTNTKTY